MPLLPAYDFKLQIGSTDYRFVLGEENGTKTWVEGLAPAIPPQIRQDTFGYDHTDPTIDLAMAFEQWPAGAGWEQAEHPHDILAGGSRGIESHRYHYTQHVDLSWGWGVKSPAIQTGATTSVAPTDFLRSQAKGFFCVAGRYVRQWSGSAWTERYDGGASVTFTDLHEYSNSAGTYILVGNAGDGATNYLIQQPPVYVDSTSNSNASDTSITVTAPTGIQDDDILIFALHLDDDPGGITLSGFTSIDSDTTGGYNQVFYKRASSESGDYTASWTGNHVSAAMVSVYRHCIGSGSPVDDFTQGTFSTTTDITVPSVTTTGDDRIVLYTVLTDANATHSAPTDFTEREDIGGGVDRSGALGDRLQLKAGDTETASITGSGSASGTVWTIALKGPTTAAFTESTLSDAEQFVYFTNRGSSSGEPVLFGITATGGLFSSTDPSDAGSWTGPDQIGGVNEVVNGITTIDDNIYIFKDVGIYKFDGTNVVFLWYAKELRDANNGTQHVVWRNKRAYVNYGNQIIELAPDNSAGDALRSVFPAQGQYASPELNGSITAMAPDFEWIWFATKNAAGNTYLWKGNPDTREFHTVAYFGSNACSALLRVEAGATDDSVQFHASNAVMLTGYATNGHYIILTCPGEPPWDCSAYRFETTQGIVFGPFVDFGTRAYPAFLSRGELVVDDVDSDDTITLQYQLPGGTATSIVVANDSNTSAYDVAAADVSTSVEFSTIRYKLLVANGAATTTPILKGIALHASPVIPRKRVWQPVVRFAEDMPLEGGGRSTQSVTDYLTALTSAIGSRMTLTDIWGTTHTVRLLDFQSQGARRVKFGGEERWEATYQLTLAGLDTLT